jgi:hypothetical protein
MQPPGFPMPPPVAPTAPAARPLPRLWPWIAAFCAGVVLAGVGFGVGIGATIASLLSTPTELTPATLTIQADTGTYYVYESTSPFSGFNNILLSPTDVTVTSTAGQGRLPTYAPASSETLSFGGTQFRAAVGFDVPVAGDYRVHVRSPGGVQTVSVAVAPSIQPAVSHRLWLLALGVLGLLAALVGGIGWIVRGVQRSRRRVAQRAAFATCANGHAAAPSDRFCAVCGAPVVPSATPVR